jgi:hypothetical protein
VVRNAVINGTRAALGRACTHGYGSTETVDHYVLSRESEVGRCEPDRAPLLAYSAPWLAVVTTAISPQDDATPKITRRQPQLGRERRVEV